MAGTTTARKPRATSTTPRRPRRTKAEIEADRALKARLAEGAGSRAEADAKLPTRLAPGVVHTADAPDIPGGALDLGSSAPADKPRIRPRVTLFRYDGIGYTIPAEFGMLDALGYADVVRREGIDAGLVWTLTMALGTVGFAKLLSLREDPAVGEDQVQKLIDIVVSRVVGVDSPKG